MILEMSPLLPGHRNCPAIQCGQNAAASRVQLLLLWVCYKVSTWNHQAKVLTSCVLPDFRTWWKRKKSENSLPGRQVCSEQPAVLHGSAALGTELHDGHHRAYEKSRALEPRPASFFM